MYVATSSIKKKNLKLYTVLSSNDLIWQVYTIKYLISSLKFCIFLLCSIKKIYFTKAHTDAPKYPQFSPTLYTDTVFNVCCGERVGS